MQESLTDQAVPIIVALLGTEAVLEFEATGESDQTDGATRLQSTALTTFFRLAGVTSLLEHDAEALGGTTVDFALSRDVDDAGSVTYIAVATFRNEIEVRLGIDQDGMTMIWQDGVELGREFYCPRLAALCHAELDDER